MRLLGRGLVVNPRVAALFALLTAGMLWPQTVRAGCSAHYVKDRLNTPGRLYRVDLLNLGGAVPAPSGRAPLDRPAPCSGAFCSGNPAIPVPAVPSIPSLTHRELAIPDSLRLAANGESFRRLLAHEPLRPVVFPCSIFHPPRSRRA